MAPAAVISAGLISGSQSGPRTTTSVQRPAGERSSVVQPSRGRANSSGATIRRVYGRGAASVAVVRPAGRGRALPLVLFLHGWGYDRRTDYAPWIRHLARGGNAVIVPRYQVGVRSDPRRVRGAMLRGLRSGLRRVDWIPGTLLVAGHSAGAALAADYAAIARRQGLPQPRAVFAVYPGRAILGTSGIPAVDPARIPASTRLLVLAGARDTVVGEAPARQLVTTATAIPPERRRLVLMRRSAVADHLAPLRSDRAARRAFWRRFDRLIERTRLPGAAG